MANINITILNVTNTTVPTAKGSYQKLDVAYKNNTFQGKVEGKTLMSFGANKPAFEAFSQNPVGESFDVEVVKNDKGYNDWVKVTKAGVAQASSAPTPSFGNKTGNPAPKSTYETPEERAQRQVYIIRQSSIASAVAALSAGAKAPVKVDDVTAYAQTLVDYVMGNDKKQDVPFKNDFSDMSNEFPDVG